MKKFLMFVAALWLSGCASQAYHDGYSRVYTTTAYPVRHVSSNYDTWLDQPFWTLDPWYYPASAYRNYSYGVTWVGGPHLYLDYYSYPLYSTGFHYSPIYVGGWFGWSSGYAYDHWSHWNHGLTDFWWDDHYPYSTRHGARREVHRLQRYHDMPRPAYRGHASRDRGYRYHDTPRYGTVEHNRSVRAVRGAYGREDGHRGRSSIDNPHAGRRSLPFVRSSVGEHGNRNHVQTRVYRRSSSHTTYRRSHSPVGTGGNRASREIHRIGYDQAPAYPVHRRESQRSSRRQAVHRYNTEVPARRAVMHEPAASRPATRPHDQERKGSHEVMVESHKPARRSHMPQPARREPAGNPHRRLPMMSVHQR